MATPIPTLDLRKIAADFKPSFVAQSNGKFTIPRVPIFMVHERRDEKGKLCKFDAAWMAECVKWQRDQAAAGKLPKVGKGHTPDDAFLATQMPNEAFSGNFAFEPTNGALYSDIIDVTPALRKEIEENKWPGRSVEVSHADHKIPVVALLGVAPSWLPLPDLKFGDDAKPMRYALYMEDANAGSPNASGGGSNPAPAPAAAPNPEEADYAKLCSLMERYIQEHPENFGAPVKKNPDKNAAPGTPGSDPDKKDIYMDTDPNTMKYAELEKTVKSQGELLTKYAAELTTLREANGSLQLERVRDQWRAKYAALRIPKDLLDIEAEVATTLLHADDAARQAYFDRRDKAFVKPSTKPVTDGKPAEDENAVLSYAEFCAKNAETLKGLKASDKMLRYNQASRRIAG